MARMPGAIWVGEHGSRRMERYDIVCIHTIVGYAPAHAAQFSTKAGGNIFQSRDTIYQSGANLNGNPRIIAIENEDHGAEFGGTTRLPIWTPLTDRQVEACGKILRFAHDTHSVPLQLCPDSRPGSRGLAYHRQGIDGNFGGYRFPGRVPGGEKWTLSYGKVCPTDVRIAQLPDILDVAKEGIDEMAEHEAQLDRIEELLKEVIARDIRQTQRVAGLVRQVRDRVNKGNQTTAELAEDVEALTEALLADDDDGGVVTPPL